MDVGATTEDIDVSMKNLVSLGCGSCGMLSFGIFLPVGTDASKFHGIFGTVEP